MACDPFDPSAIGRTAIVIAHRLLSLRDADLIVVLEVGHLIEDSLQAELSARNGAYARLRGRQMFCEDTWHAHK
ncbi:hypothetical protein V8J82_01860 [Gymnodinialimonas sp. 2305UL16-5]|uniref:hypothetical protein n=1 Tax=Gymnodinialimonas mytili TaxID=3126503 RepID=UPI00309C3B52